MSKQPIFALDMSLENSIKEVLPRPPLLTSYQLGWKDLYVQHHLQSPGETPEACGIHHTIVVHYNKQTIYSQRMLDGKRQEEWQGNGDIVIIPAQAHHQSSWDRDTEFTALFLDPNYLKQIAYESIDPDRVEIIPRFSSPDPLIYQIGLSLKSELEKNGLATRLYVDSLKTMLAATLIQKYSTKVRSLREENKEHSQHRLKEAIDYINDNLAEDLSLRDISSIIHVSPYYFSRMFKRSTGLSPHQYLLRRRIEVAKQLLLRKNSSILEISQQVGFASQSHFIKVFRKYTGATPKNYREEID